MGARSGDLYNEISQMNYNRQPRQSTGYNFAPLDYPAQQWINPEMVAMNQAMFASGSIYDYLEGVKAWYPPPKVKSKKSYGPSGMGQYPQREVYDADGESSHLSPSGISPHGFGTNRGQNTGRYSRESDQEIAEGGWSVGPEGFSYAD